jgi:hypothetical protein
MITETILTLLLLIFSASLGGPLQEIAFLDLEKAERSQEELHLALYSLSGVTGLKPVPAFRLLIEPPVERSVRPGDTIELVARLENIVGEKLAIPFETNWKHVLGEVPGDMVSDFPEGYMWAVLGAWVRPATESGEVSRLPFASDGTLYGCLCQPESVRLLNPGESVRFRALATVPQGLGEGPWGLAVELQFMHGLNTARYQRSVSSEPIILEISASPAETEKP